MRTTSVGLYALRLSVGQPASQLSTQTCNNTLANAQPDKVVTRAAAMLAVFGLALSSFSLKQMVAKGGNRNRRQSSFGTSL